MQPGAAAQIAAAAAGRSCARPLKRFTEQIRGTQKAPRPDSNLDCAGCMWAPEAVQECSISCLQGRRAWNCHDHSSVTLLFCFCDDDDDDDDDGAEPKWSPAVGSDEQLPHLEQTLFDRKKKMDLGISAGQRQLTVPLGPLQLRGRGHIYRSPEGCRLYNATRWLAPCSSAPFMDADICLETRARELDSRAAGGEGDVHALVCSGYKNDGPSA